MHRMSRIQWPRAKFAAMMLLALMFLGFGAIAEVNNSPTASTTFVAASGNSADRVSELFSFCSVKR